jgi:hypothetical protein
MAWSTTDIITEGLGFLRICPITFLTTGPANALGTVTDLVNVTKEGDEFANSSQASTEYLEKQLSNRTNLKLQITKVTINPATGESAAADSDAFDKFDVSVLLTKSQKDTLIGLIRTDAVYLACMGIGRTAAGTVAGYEYLIGKMTGNITEERTGDYSEVNLSIQGGKAYTAETGFSYTAINTKFNALVTPTGQTAITPTALAATVDVPALLTGQILRKAAS